jgi:hypothetical protein
VSSDTVNTATVGKISHCDADSVTFEINSAADSAAVPSLPVGHILSGTGDSGSKVSDPGCYGILRKVTSTQQIDATHLKVFTSR